MEKTKSSQTFLLVIILVFAIGIFGIMGFMLYQTNQTNKALISQLGQTKKNEENIAPSISPIESVSPKETDKPIESPAPIKEDVTTEIAKALALKNKWDKWDNLEITISYNDSTYAKGGATEKNAEAGGGYWFAKKVNGSWVIVADGNGTISCSSLAPYPDYPVSLISECYDDVKNVSVKR
jgi:hypothetical protein